MKSLAPRPTPTWDREILEENLFQREVLQSPLAGSLEKALLGKRVAEAFADYIWHWYVERVLEAPLVLLLFRRALFHMIPPGAHHGKAARHVECRLLRGSMDNGMALVDVPFNRWTLYIGNASVKRSSERPGGPARVCEP